MRKKLAHNGIAELGRDEFMEGLSKEVKEFRLSPKYNGKSIEGFKLRRDIF